PGAAAQHHAPAQSMPFLGPEHIIHKKMVPQRQSDLNHKVNPQNDQNAVFVFWKDKSLFDFNGLGLEKNVPDGLWFKKEQGKGKGQIGEDPDLEHDTVEKVEEYGQHKGNFP